MYSAYLFMITDAHCFLLPTVFFDSLLKLLVARQELHTTYVFQRLALKGIVSRNELENFFKKVL